MKLISLIITFLSFFTFYSALGQVGQGKNNYNESFEYESGSMGHWYCNPLTSPGTNYHGYGDCHDDSKPERYGWGDNDSKKPSGDCYNNDGFGGTGDYSNYNGKTEHKPDEHCWGSNGGIAPKIPKNDDSIKIAPKKGEKILDTSPNTDCHWLATPYINFIPGETYKIRTYIGSKLDLKPTWDFFFDRPDGIRGNFKKINTVTVPDNNKWYEFTYTYKHPATADEEVGSFAFIFNNPGGRNRFYMDDLTISATGPGIQYENPTCNLITIANNDTATTPENTEVNIDIAKNDTIPSLVGSADDTTVSVVSKPENGSVNKNSNNTLDYDPDKNFNGWDTLSYRICDAFKHCDTAEVYIKVGCVEIVNAGPNDNVCEDQNSYTLNNADTSSISGPFEWSRTSDNAGSGGSFSDPSALNPTYTFSSDDKNNGSVELELKATSATCAEPDTIKIEIDPLPKITMFPDDTNTCAEQDDTLSLEATATNIDSNTIQWTSSGSSGTLNNDDSLNVDYIPSEADIKNGGVDITLSADGMGCNNTSVSKTVAVNIIALPNAGIKPDTLNCANSSVTLDGSGTTQSGNTNYTWSTSNGNITSDTVNEDATIDEEGNYTLLVEDAKYGCKTDSTINIKSFQSKPIANIVKNKNELTCNDTLMILDGSDSDLNTSRKDDSLIFQWENISGNIKSSDLTNDSIIVNQEGDYRLKVTNNFNHCTDKTVINIPANKGKPEARIAPPDTFSCVKTLNLDGSKSSSYTGKGLNYNWSSIDKSQLKNKNQEKAEVIKPGNFLLEVEDKGNGCIDTAKTEVEKYPPAIVDAGDTIFICTKPPSESVKNATVKRESTFSWKILKGNGTINDKTKLNPVYNFANSDYNLNAVKLELSAKDKGECITTKDTMYFKFTDLPIPNTIASKTCQNQKYRVNDSDLIITGGNYSKIVWNNIKGKGTLQDKIGKNPVYKPASQDTLIDSVKLEASIEGCETVKDTFHLKVHALPVFELDNDTTICQNHTITLKAGKGVSYNWNNGKSKRKINVSEAGTYSVNVTNKNNCHYKDSINISLAPVYNPVNENIILLCDNETKEITIDKSFTNIQWFKNFKEIPGKTNHSLEVKTKGTYTVKAKDKYGCTVKDTFQVNDQCGVAVFVPDIFTPNGDGHNDHLELFGYNVDDLEFLLFNRWGEIIYVSHSLENKWDGVYRGKKAQDGSYTYKLKYEGEKKDGEKVKEVKYGEIVIAR